MTIEPNPIGRPSDYNARTVDAICARLAEGESLRAICREPHFPSLNTVYSWIRKYPEFREQYDRAREDQIDTLADELLDIADDARNDWMEKENKDGTTYECLNAEHVQRSRLRVETRKWIAERMKPKKYGMTTTNKIEGTLNVTQMPMIAVGDKPVEPEIGAAVDSSCAGDTTDPAEAEPDTDRDQ